MTVKEARLKLINTLDTIPEKKHKLWVDVFEKILKFGCFKTVYDEKKVLPEILEKEMYTLFDYRSP